MSEKLSNPERQSAKKETAAELEKLRHSPEQNREISQAEIEKRQEKARQTIEKNAERAKVEKAVEKGSTSTEKEKKDHRFSRKEKRLAFKKEIKRVQAQLPPASRALSRVVHNPVVENISEVLEETVLRPSVLIGGATVGLIGGGIFYLYARVAGFALSGSEFLVSMVAGALIGVVLEIIYKWFKH